MKKILLHSSLITLAIIIGYQVYIFFKIDSCLDKGDVWNYPKSICISDDNLSIDAIKCLSIKKTWDKEKQVCEK